MSNDLRIIADIFEEMNGNGYASGHRFVPLNEFDFTKFNAQESGIEGITTEFVNEKCGGGMTGDEFAGTMAFPVAGQMLLIDYYS